MEDNNGDLAQSEQCNITNPIMDTEIEEKQNVYVIQSVETQKAYYKAYVIGSEKNIPAENSYSTRLYLNDRNSLTMK